MSVHAHARVHFNIMDPRYHHSVSSQTATRSRMLLLSIPTQFSLYPPLTIPLHTLLQRMQLHVPFFSLSLCIHSSQRLRATGTDHTTKGNKCVSNLSLGGGYSAAVNEAIDAL